VFLVETDVIVAAINVRDPLHELAKSILSRGKMMLSPYALIELNLLIRSRIIVVRDYSAFWRKMNNLLEYYEIKVLAPKPEYHLEASILRDKYNLSYFDSLHAATSIIEGLTLISFDRDYGNVEGLKYVHPSKL